MSFARKDKLALHMHIHTGENTYYCELCTKTFTRQYSLTSHMLILERKLLTATYVEIRLHGKAI